MLSGECCRIRSQVSPLLKRTLKRTHSLELEELTLLELEELPPLELEELPPLELEELLTKLEESIMALEELLTKLEALMKLQVEV